VKDRIAYIPVQRLLCSDVHVHAEQLFEILNQRRVIEQAAARLPVDQQIEIAAFRGVAARHGSRCRSGHDVPGPGLRC